MNAGNATWKTRIVRRLLWLLDLNGIESIVGRSLEGVCADEDRGEEDPSDISGLEALRGSILVIRGQPFTRQVHFHPYSLLQRR